MDTYCESFNFESLCEVVPAFSFSVDHDTIRLINTSAGVYNISLWNMDDGSALNGNAVEYIYPENGNYEVCLTVGNSNIDDCTFTICQSVEIDACRVDAAFTFDINQDTLFAEINSLDHVSFLSWDFGNGFSSTNNPVEYIYTAEGNYTLCLTALDQSQFNCQSTICEEINISLTHTLEGVFNHIEIYPNPIKQGEAITLSNPDQLQIDIEVYNEAGQKIQTKVVQEVDKVNIETDALASGIYHISMKHKDQLSTIRIIVY